MNTNTNNGIQIKPLRIDDISHLKNLFEKTISEIFERNNIKDKIELEHEINDKIDKVSKSILEEESIARFFFSRKRKHYCRYCRIFIDK
jgi:hypothetical protein